MHAMLQRCASAGHVQVTQLERGMNVLVFVQFSILLAFCAVLAGLDQWWTARHSAPAWWYLQSVNAYPDLPPGVAAWFVAVSASRSRAAAGCNACGARERPSQPVAVVIARGRRIRASTRAATATRLCRPCLSCGAVSALPDPAVQHDPHQPVRVAGGRQGLPVRPAAQPGPSDVPRRVQHALCVPHDHAQRGAGAGARAAGGMHAAAALL